MHFILFYFRYIQLFEAIIAYSFLDACKEGKN